MNRDEPVTLITALGATNYDGKNYTFNGRLVLTGRLATVALWKLLEATNTRVNRVIVLYTQGVLSEDKRFYPELSSDPLHNLAAFSLAARAADLDPELITAIEIHMPDSLEDAFELYSILEKTITACTGDHSPLDIIFDFTTSFRAIPLIMLSAFRLLGTKQLMRLAGIWYAKVDRNEPAAPLIDLTPMLTMGDMAEALSLWNRYRLPDGLTDQLTILNKRLWTAPDRDRAAPPPVFAKLSRPLCNIRQPLAYGLPLEAAQALGALGGLVPAASGELHRLLPPLAEDFHQVMTELADIAPAADAPVKNKSDIPLTKSELDRQLRMIALMGAWQAAPAAVRLLREWLVSRVVYESHAVDGVVPGVEWLDRETRERASHYLGLLGQAAQKDNPQPWTVDEEQLRIGRLFGRIVSLRNQIAHNGMTADQVKLCDLDRKLGEMIGEAGELHESIEEAWRLPGSEAVTVITPCGESRGVVYNAVMNAWHHGSKIPGTAVWVLVSEKTRAGAEEAAAAAMADMPEGALQAPRFFMMRDAFVFDSEEAERFRRAVCGTMALGGTVYVNFTGGTSVMGYMVMTLAHELSRAFCRVHLEYLMDLRHPDEQKAEPYVLCEAGFIGVG
ncbi:hypothetical protein JW905_15880 [bacterium]|nr:hypothetical protein [candidate division CSSED10-310 bacterium]